MNEHVVTTFGRSLKTSLSFMTCMLSFNTRTWILRMLSLILLVIGTGAVVPVMYVKIRSNNERLDVLETSGHVYLSVWMIFGGGFVTFAAGCIGLCVCIHKRHFLWFASTTLAVSMADVAIGVASIVVTIEQIKIRWKIVAAMNGTTAAATHALSLRNLTSYIHVHSLDTGDVVANVLAPLAKYEDMQNEVKLYVFIPSAGLLVAAALLLIGFVIALVNSADLKEKAYQREYTKHPLSPSLPPSGFANESYCEPHHEMPDWQEPECLGPPFGFPCFPTHQSYKPELGEPFGHRPISRALSAACEPYPDYGLPRLAPVHHEMAPVHHNLSLVRKTDAFRDKCVQTTFEGNPYAASHYVGYTRRTKDPTSFLRYSVYGYTSK